MYSVEEVSELLGIPRPTLYRYLREYSIPHVRKSGKISIPEDSFEWIRSARDLHREGFSTNTVRTRLREDRSEANDTGEISVKLERLTRDLESLKGDPKALEEASSPHALRTILARQSLLISAVFNLTGMVEELMRASGQARRRLFDDVAELRGRDDMELGGLETRLARSRPVEKSIRLSRPESSDALSGPVREFGSLGQRRKKGAAVLLAAFIVCAAAVWILSTTGVAFGGGDEDRRDEARPAERMVAVPDLSGLSETEAGERLEGAGLNLENRTPDRSGEVVDQAPDPGAEVQEGKTVEVTLEARRDTNPPDEDSGGDSSSGASQYGEDVFEYTE
ncbi:MAG: PASTA domain-containing protein [Rubrobacteraceae bacterium]